MKQFIDKLISRLEEEKEAYSDTTYYALGVGSAIKIVNQLAEEYKGGWILCSERLPEEPGENPDIDYKTLEIYLVCVPGEKYPFRAFWNGKFFADGLNKVDTVAWMPLPSPYHPEK